MARDDTIFGVRVHVLGGLWEKEEFQEENQRRKGENEEDGRRPSTC